MVRVGAYGMRWGPYDKAVELAVEAERAGFDWIVYADQLCSSRPRSMWDTDVTDVAGLIESLDAYYDPAPLVASAAAVTSRIRFIWGVIDAVRRHPSMIAQTLLTLDHATKGRAVTILANGENKQMKPYGISRKGANDKLWDAVQMVRLFLERDDPISMEGRVWKLDRAKVDLPPYGDVPPEVWVAGGGSEVFELVGRHADGWFTYAPGGTEDDPAEFAAQLATIREHARAAGRDPMALSIGMVLIAVVHDDEDVLDELRDHPIVRWNTMLAVPTSATYARWGLTHPFSDRDRGGWMFSRDCIPPWISKEEALSVAARTPRAAVDRVHFVGTPEQCYARIAPYLDLGVTDTFIVNYSPICDTRYVESGKAAGERLLKLVQSHR